MLRGGRVNGIQPLKTYILNIVLPTHFDLSQKAGERLATSHTFYIEVFLWSEKTKLTTPTPKHTHPKKCKSQNHSTQLCERIARRKGAGADEGNSSCKKLKEIYNQYL